MDKSSPNGDSEEKMLENIDPYMLLISEHEDEDGAPLFVFEVIQNPEEL